MKPFTEIDLNAADVSAGSIDFPHSGHQIVGRSFGSGSNPQFSQTFFDIVQSIREEVPLVPIF